MTLGFSTLAPWGLREEIIAATLEEFSISGGSARKTSSTEVMPCSLMN
jgi:hypothetical protein